MTKFEYPTPDGTTLLIGGKWTGSKSTTKRFDPADLSIETGVFADGDASHVDAAYAAAATAAPGWARMSMVDRAGILLQAATILESRAESCAQRLTADIGKAIRDARGEVMRSASTLRYYAAEISQPIGNTYQSSSDDTLLFTVQEPVGIVCMITPWNFPFAIPAFKVSPALAYGNTVVWKPAEAASGSAVLLAEIFQEAGLPPGVLNIVTGDGVALSESLTSDPRLDALTFTGSNPVGRLLRRAVSGRNVKVQLELGGKNPAIVLADANIADAATQITRGAMFATGQRCTATSRVYVQRDVLGDFCDGLVDSVNALKVGDPFDDATDVGPLASIRQRSTVLEYLKIAALENATFLTGDSVAEPRDNDCFVTPAVLTDVPADSRVVREEIFGPVAVVAPFSSYEDAIAAANGSPYGLSAAVFTSKISTAMDFVRRSESGLVHINRETAGIEPHVPFGGTKDSGSMSQELGKAAREFFTTCKTVYLRSVN